MIPAAILLIILVVVDLVSHVALWSSYLHMRDQTYKGLEDRLTRLEKKAS